jgi:hypothetical protein
VEKAQIANKAFIAKDFLGRDLKRASAAVRVACPSFVFDFRYAPVERRFPGRSYIEAGITAKVLVQFRDLISNRPKSGATASNSSARKLFAESAGDRVASTG